MKKFSVKLKLNFNFKNVVCDTNVEKFFFRWYVIIVVTNTVDHCDRNADFSK